MTSTPTNPPEDDALMLDAYADGELDAAGTLRIERRLEADPALKVEYERLTALRGALRANLRRDTPSPALRRRIEAIAAPDTAIVSSRKFDWRQLAASVLIAAGVASGATVFALRPDAGGGEVGSIVAEHRRTLLAASPVDVETSDRHTVKPWFDGKLALSPQVNDLATDGFPLVGGRVDVAGGKLVPAMIYRRHAHLLSLVAVPRAGSRDDGGAATSASQDGYAVARWHGQDFDYYAVSDIAPDDLALFVAKWRAASKP